MSVRTVGRSRLVDQSGLGMIEVMIAIFVLAVALMALASVSLSTLDSLRDTRDREQASNAASSAIEDVRSRDFRDIALATGTFDPDRLPAGAPIGQAGTDPLCFGLASQPAGERLVVDDVDDPVPFEQSAGDEQAYTVHTLVTYDGVDCADTDGRSDLKRITAIVSWADGGSGEVLVQTSTVTDVDRGLPVPRFEIRPEQSTIRFSDSYLTDTQADPHRRCSEHVLRNLGAEDSYDWEVREVVDTSTGDVVSGTPPLTPITNGYEVDGWRYTAHLEPDSAGIDREGEPPSSDEYRFTDESGFARLVSDLRLDSGESGLLTLCAEPTSSTDPADLPDEVEVKMLVRSRFDERVEREVTPTVRIADPNEDPASGEPLYLFDHDDANRHVRRYEPGDMGPLAGVDDDPELISHLSTHDYDPADANWSTDVGVEDLSGIRLLEGASGQPADPQIDASTAAWHYQFGTGTTLEPEATLVLWVAPPVAFSSGFTQGDEVPVAFEVRVDELTNSESPPQDAWVATTIREYTHTTPEAASTGGWQQVEVPIDLGAERHFKNNRYIRVRVTCVAPTVLGEGEEPEDCNLAYDNIDYRSALYIQVR